MTHSEISIIDRIRARYPELSAGHKAIAQFVVSQTAHCAFLPITRLAEMSGVSAATVVRFSQILGYAGYPELQSAIRDLVLNQINLSQRLEDIEVRMEGLLSGEIPMDAYELMRTVMIAQAEHITTIADSIAREEFLRAIQEIVEASTVYVIGLRLSSATATALWHGLYHIRPNVVLVNSGSGFMPEQLTDCGPGDLLIGITYRRYMLDTLRVMEFARARGARIMAITDNRLSPAASMADLALVTPVIMHLSHIPLAPSMALISAILECLSLHYRHAGGSDRARALYQDAQQFNLFSDFSDDTQPDESDNLS